MQSPASARTTHLFLGEGSIIKILYMFFPFKKNVKTLERKLDLLLDFNGESLPINNIITNY